MAIHPFTDKKGITLIELVLGMVLIGIVALVVANALSTGITGFFVTDYRKEALDQARIAMDRMAKEMRNVRTSSDIGTATSSELCFVNTQGTRINFRYESPYIRRLEGGGACPGGAETGDILATGVSNVTFSGIFKYVLSTGAEVEDATGSETLIKRIKIDFKATAGSESISLPTEVWPRNL